MMMPSQNMMAQYRREPDRGGHVNRDKAAAMARVAQYAPQPQPQPQADHPSTWRAPMHGAQAQLGIVAATQQAPISAALKHVQDEYIHLSRAGAMIANMMRAKGGPLPCEVYDLYHRAVKNYLVSAQQIFNAAAKHNIQVRQVVYSGGKPVADPNEPGGVRSIAIGAALRPPTFTTRNFCPNVTHLSGPGFGTNLGAGPVAWAIFAVVVTAGSYVLLGKAEDVMVSWKAPDPDAPSRMRAMAECVERVGKIYGVAPGEQPSPAVLAKIEKQCRIMESKWSPLAIVGLVAVAGVVVGGGAWFYFRGLPALRERREQREADREEAERLEAEAARKVERAKKLRKRRGRKAEAEVEYLPPGAAIAGSDRLGACPCAL